MKMLKIEKPRRETDRKKLTGGGGGGGATPREFQGKKSSGAQQRCGGRVGEAGGSSERGVMGQQAVGLWSAALAPEPTPSNEGFAPKDGETV